MVQSGPKLDFRRVFFSVFQEGRGQRFLRFFCVFTCIGRLLFEQFLETCGLLAKSADPRFLYTVQRFNLISRVWGLPKHRKNSKKTVLEIIVFRRSKKVLLNLVFQVFL